MHDQTTAATPEVLVGPIAALAEALLHRIAAAAAMAVAQRGSFSLAIPGGSVATSFLPYLAHERSFDWQTTHLWWTDERAVAATDPDSNFDLARRLLIDPVGMPPAQVHRMPADDSDLDRAAVAYQRELVRQLGDPPQLDVALLGVGPDGHVASLFPGHPLLAETERLVAPVFDAPKPPARRLTLTLPVLAAARLVIVAAFGDEKAAVIRAALDDPQSPLPVARVARRTGPTLFLLDAAAAAGRAETSIE